MPKDGPSAGIALATSIASLLTNQKVDANLAMTGEITLTGQVLPIGGLKEKVLGAKRAGISKILLPKRNEVDLEDVPKEVRDTMTFVAVDDISDVFEQAFGKRIVTPLFLGPGSKGENVVVPMRRTNVTNGKRPAGERKRTPARARTAVATRKH